MPKNKYTIKMSLLAISCFYIFINFSRLLLYFRKKVLLAAFLSSTFCISVLVQNIFIDRAFFFTPWNMLLIVGFCLLHFAYPWYTIHHHRIRELFASAWTIENMTQVELSYLNFDTTLINDYYLDKTIQDIEANIRNISNKFLTSNDDWEESYETAQEKIRDFSKVLVNSNNEYPRLSSKQKDVLTLLINAPPSFEPSITSIQLNIVINTDATKDSTYILETEKFEPDVTCAYNRNVNSSFTRGIGWHADIDKLQDPDPVAELFYNSLEAILGTQSAANNSGPQTPPQYPFDRTMWFLPLTSYSETFFGFNSGSLHYFIPGDKLLFRITHKFYDDVEPITKSVEIQF